VTEEVWRWWHDDSVHLAPWPILDELGEVGVDPGSIYQPVCDVLEAIRREKSTQKVSQRARVIHLEVHALEEFANALRVSADDLVAAGNVDELSVIDASDLRVSVTLEAG